MHPLRHSRTISIHAPAGGATAGAKSTTGDGPISIHAPAGGATPAAYILLRPVSDFNSRPCGRGDRTISPPKLSTINFNSRPCGRGDLWCCGRPRFYPISIHAPAGGATYIANEKGECHVYFNSRPCGRGDRQNGLFLLSPYISIHAPAGGATPRTSARTSGFNLFQFTPLREGRPAVRIGQSIQQSISIHASAGGATGGRRPNPHRVRYFNSRPCGRGDSRIFAVTSSARYFNSRPCGRGDT